MLAHFCTDAKNGFGQKTFPDWIGLWQEDWLHSIHVPRICRADNLPAIAQTNWTSQARNRSPGTGIATVYKCDPIGCAPRKIRIKSE